MKKIIIIACALLFASLLQAQIKSFRFIHVSDTHIGSPDGKAEEDLRRTVKDINQMQDIDFVIITGDITELGKNDELKLAKQILDSLGIKYYIIPGNHDTGWSESGGFSFIRTFGSDKFMFDHKGIRFIGCASGPYVRMSDGHIPRDAINWLDGILKNTKQSQPLVFVNHYPLDPGLDNWYEVTSRLRRFNTLAILCGHGHANRAMEFEDIPGVMGRSNLRARKQIGGFNIVTVTNDSIIYSERITGTETLAPWIAVKIVPRNYDIKKKFERPDFSMNKLYSGVKAQWIYSSGANIISTPAVVNSLAIVGNQTGEVVALSLKDGSQKWKFITGGSIFSSPATAGDKVVFGSADSNIYCLNSKNGKLVWKKQTGASVLGSPLISGDTIFIGGSDHQLYAIDISNGKTFWQFDGLNGPVVSSPIVYEDKLIFGAWDRYLYCIDRKTGKFNWKWSNGSSIINFSPAACTPVAHEQVVYVVAPDRYVSAIDVMEGKTLWRNNESTVRESIGISEDEQFIYGKTMQDTIVAYRTGTQPQHPAWKMHCGFGYEHTPSRLIEKEGQLFFGTKNGVVYSIDPVAQKINWKYKIDNSMVNTLNVIDKHHLLVSTMDGKMVLITIKDQ